MNDDLAGDISISVHDDYGFNPDRVAVVVDQQLTPIVRYTTWVPVSRNLLEDSTAFNGAIEYAMDRWLRPWKHADRNPIPTLDLFPIVTRTQQGIRRLRSLPAEVRTRARETLHVLRHGLPDGDDW